MVLAHFTSLIMRGSKGHVTDEADLFRRAKAYDPAALGELYDRYAPRMYAYIYRRVGDAALAEDLTGELFVRALQAIQGGRAWRDSLVAWLYRIAHNLVVDHYRRRPAAPALPLDEVALVVEGGNPAGVVEGALPGQQLRAALGGLTAEQQEVLALRFGEGLTARQAARVLRKTTGAVEALQRRALASLRRVLEKEEGS